MGRSMIAGKATRLGGVCVEAYLIKDNCDLLIL